LRDVSPAASDRSRANSVASQKRKEWSDICEDDNEPPYRAKVSRLDVAEDDELVFLESKISKVGTMYGKMVTDLQKIPEMDNSVRALLADLMETVKMTNEVQESIATMLRKNKVSVTKSTPSYSAALMRGDFPEIAPDANPNRYRSRMTLAGGLLSSNSDSRGKFSAGTQAEKIPPESEEEKKKRKFTEAIKDAERSTLCFNLDMGNVPLMNKSTISEKASTALTKMAAQKEKAGTSIPSQDAVAAIDDVISLVTNMDFFGSTTKQYKGKGTTGFCTVPVKYQFKDKDYRLYAEKTLREKCDVKCATPYPAIVRECIKQVVDHVRLTHPSDFVKVSVVSKEFSLKVSRRPQGKNLKWIDYPDLLPLPSEAWNVDAKKVPDGLRMFYLPVENDDMTVSPSHREKEKSPVKQTRRGSKDTV
jgi:hypothetical protein